MDDSFFSIIPPMIVLLLGFLTRRIFLSLIVGVLSASLIAHQFDVIPSGLFFFRSLITNLEINKLIQLDNFWSFSNLFICLFLCILGITIQLIHQSGGSYAYENIIRRKLTKRKNVEASSLFLSSCLCLDDYFSSLTVGSVMRPISDSFRIPRAKLAFLVDSMAAPIAILCPFSTWVAFIIGVLNENGVSSSVTESTRIVASPFLLYFSTLPFLFYSFLIIFFSWFIVLKGISFGYMRVHERVAQKTGNVFNYREPKKSFFKDQSFDSPKIIDFILPILFLISFVLLGLLLSGGWSTFGGERSFVEALRQAAASAGLFVGGCLTMLTTTVYYLCRQRIGIRELPSIYKKGALMMLPSVVILILAWTLGDILQTHLHTGHYLASLFVHVSRPEFLPIILFLVASLVAFATGSSWGTAAIMFPIGIEMLISLSGVAAPLTLLQIPLLPVVMGAILSGCVAGDHLSPISDTTIMTATSTTMVHEEHVRTQMTYALPVVFLCAFSFLLYGFLEKFQVGFGLLISLSSSALLGMLVFSYLSQRSKS